MEESVSRGIDGLRCPQCCELDSVAILASDASAFCTADNCDWTACEDEVRNTIASLTKLLAIMESFPIKEE